MRVEVKKLHPDAVIPHNALKGDVGVDLYSIEAAAIEPGERKLFGTGIALKLEAGYEMQIRPRSGLAANHGITVLNSPATIEPTYRGEIKVILINTSRELYQVSKGDRIAQAVFKRYEEGIEFTEVEELDKTHRGDGGFGHTGR